VAVPLLDGGDVRAVVALALFPWPADAGAGGLATRSAGAEPRGGLDMLHDVEMEVSAELGRTRMSVRELLSLAPGAIIELDRAAGSPADLLVNGRLIARGEVVVVDENFGIRITEIVTPGGERE
jgi:flagellar motor switch protein FliN/FliY